MQVPDVNILVYAHREDRDGDQAHHRFKGWLQELIERPEPYGLFDNVLSGFLRIVTHPRIFTPPSLTSEALAFVEDLRSQPNCVVVRPGARHWEIFTGLCRTTRATGNLIPDAYLAALAIESGSEWVTTDGDFGRFPGLRWRYPFT